MIRKEIFHKIFLLALLLCASPVIWGQKALNDSLQIAQSNAKVHPHAKTMHSPRKASIYSALLPGLGQAYNKKYWKIPLIYAGFGALGYFIHWNNNNYQTIKIAYNDFTDSDPSTNSYVDLDGAQYYNLNKEPDITNFKKALVKQQDYYRRNRDLLIISTIAFYGLNIIDASVDAHFFDFDISDDLSLNWQPTVSPYHQQAIYGIHCSFSF